jgi:hypothetical protein
MKGICFTFDAFGQWSEYDRRKMKWRMKVGIEWRPSMAGWPKLVVSSGESCRRAAVTTVWSTVDHPALGPQIL